MTKLFKSIILLLAILGLSNSSYSKTRIYELSKLGLKPNTQKNASPIFQKILSNIKAEYQTGDTIILKLSKGKYNFHEKESTIREYYISNHDQVNPKKVGIAIENLDNFMLDGQGAELIFHGRMLPIALIESKNCILKNFSIDFENPHIAQIKIISNDKDKGITFEVAPWVNYRISKDTIFETMGEGWTAQQNTGIAFEEKTKRIVYNTSDLFYSTKGAKEISSRVVNAPQWKDSRLIPGTVVAMRTWYRPAPGIFLHQNTDTTLKNIKVHYAEGMGLLAQLCENITLDEFSTCLKGENDPRYFTTQADATHFSGCKGKIISQNGIYEGMMDDAINVHGTYLKVIKRIDDYTLIGKYMHPQAWGFTWGNPKDEVQFVKSSTMDLIGNKNTISSIRPYDKETIEGAKEFIIKFDDILDPAISENENFGIENLTWTPEVIFSNNIIRNNRARGALFSTPKAVLVENNIFDHTSGTAILLCGDCNGWFETGACTNVIIRKNKFVNALTNMFQFTNAIISIYPEIPNLEGQQKYFHGGILIEDNEFDTFDAPVLYAKSVNGLIYRNNIVKKNSEYKPFHWNKNRFLLERVTNVEISE